MHISSRLLDQMISMTRESSQDNDFFFFNIAEEDPSIHGHAIDVNNTFEYNESFEMAPEGTFIQDEFQEDDIFERFVLNHDYDASENFGVGEGETSSSATQVPSLNFVHQRHSLDVLMGRGTRSNKNEGNRLFLQAKDEMQERYKKTQSKREKTEMSKELVRKVASWGGRFIQLYVAENDNHNNDDGLERWYEVSSKVALTKASQALRDVNTAEVRDRKRRKYKK